MKPEAEQIRPQLEARALIGRLYQTHNPRCYRAALALLGVPRLAEEAVQETWLKAVRLAETAPAEEVERQLSTILKNTALDLRRRPGIGRPPRRTKTGRRRPFPGPIGRGKRNSWLVPTVRSAVPSGAWCEPFCWQLWCPP